MKGALLLAYQAVNKNLYGPFQRSSKRCAWRQIIAELVIFIATVAVILATPGPTNALLTASAILVGLRGSLHLIAAELSGYALSIGLLLAINHPIIAAFPSLGLVVRAALAIYLLWLAARFWNANATRTEKRSELVTWRRVFVTTLLNPKGVVFAFGVFPRLATLSDVALHAATFALTTTLIASGWLMFGASLERLAGGWKAAVLPRVTALVLLAFAAILGCSVILNALPQKMLPASYNLMAIPQSAA